jgi:hypothetical protein
VIKVRCFAAPVRSYLINIPRVCKSTVDTKLHLLLNGVQRYRSLPSVALRSFWANMSRHPGTDHITQCWLAVMAAIFAFNSVIVPAISTRKRTDKDSAMLVCNGVILAVFQYCVRQQSVLPARRNQKVWKCATNVHSSFQPQINYTGHEYFTPLPSI